MRNCREISFFISQALDKKLTVRERISVRLHVIMCAKCHNFQKKTWLIRKAALNYIERLSKNS